MSHEKDRPIAGHEYDGISELDNDLPMWWVAIFVGTVIFAAIYYFHYEMSTGPSSSQELAASLKDIQALKGPESNFGEEQLAAMFTTETVAKGKEIFDSKCAACHRADGGGQIGPNLTDKYWIHGKGERVTILKTIVEGVAAKGMPPWGELLPEADRIAVTSYVFSLKGTNVPNGKPAQGDEAP